ncbi:hypothetical protein BV22DRAFT_40109 [Leucogyrophana mollusca]|uniref:Uncharacterized protein n=1 Tax=Leucogyrophana mollusca TaxID=85980 RepID=A0ACB8C1L0_9AGAM|nr:hypothetical protein BV22DRAFT_40109 [Leucogyrophana mollusca]
MGSIFSAIGSGINAVISAIAGVIMAIVGAITTVSLRTTRFFSTTYRLFSYRLLSRYLTSSSTYYAVDASDLAGQACAPAAGAEEARTKTSALPNSDILRPRPIRWSNTINIVYLVWPHFWRACTIVWSR